MKYTNDIIWEVWSKGEIFAGNDPVFWRKDQFGAWIFRGHYGRKDSEYGWIIDYIKPLSKGGTDDISNLCPLQCDNTTRKADGNIECHVTSAGVHNDKSAENRIIEYPNLNIFDFHYLNLKA